MCQLDSQQLCRANRAYFDTRELNCPFIWFFLTFSRFAANLTLLFAYPFFKDALLLQFYSA